MREGSAKKSFSNPAPDLTNHIYKKTLSRNLPRVFKTAPKEIRRLQIGLAELQGDKGLERRPALLTYAIHP